MKRPMALLAVTLSMAAGAGLRAEVIPAERRMVWSPGMPGEFPEPAASVNVKDYGAAGDGTADDTEAFRLAIQDFYSDRAVLFIPAGTYRLTETLLIDKRTVLRGEGPEQTRLVFDFGGSERNCIEILTYRRGPWVRVLGGAERNARRVRVEAPESFSPGEFAEIQQDNDSTRFYFAPEWDSEWVQNAVGQVSAVDSVLGDTLVFREPLSISYDDSLHPVVRAQELVEYAGVENLRLERFDDGAGHTLFIKNAAYCRVSNVESVDAGQSHVFMVTAYRCEVTGSYFHGAHRYSGGDFAYGITCTFHSTANLVENNIFQRLVHALAVDLGASGNVFGYNYSFEPVVLQAAPFADAVVHGFYAHHNLFESNAVQEMAASEYGGPAGPGNTFFRNRVESAGISVSAGSLGQNVVGNSLVAPTGFISVDGSAFGALVHGNVLRGAVQWDPDIPDHNLQDSYYKSGKPEFFGTMEWPAFGPDAADGSLPSQNRIRTAVDPVQAAERPSRPGITLFPNPFNGEATVHFVLTKPAVVSLSMYDIRGRKVAAVFEGRLERGPHRAAVGPALNRKDLPSGVYVLVLDGQGGILKTKFTLLR